jgi:hypothetical protein
MSYPPPPYSPPPLGPPPDFNTPFGPADPLRPARQAAVVLLVLCGLALAAALLFYCSANIPMAQWPPDQRQQIQQVIAHTGWSIHSLFTSAAVTILVVGLVLGGLGLLVRRGYIAAIFAALVLNGLLLVLVGFSLIQGVINPAANTAASLCMAVGIFALFAFLFTRLLLAAKLARQARMYGAQYQSQYWQDQWNQQGGYGYGYGPPLPPPPPPPSDTGPKHQ